MERDLRGALLIIMRLRDYFTNAPRRSRSTKPFRQHAVKNGGLLSGERLRLFQLFIPAQKVTLA